MRYLAIVVLALISIGTPVYYIRAEWIIYSPVEQWLAIVLIIIWSILAVLFSASIVRRFTRE